MSGMDNVRNMTGSPIAGIDPHEFLDVRPLNYGAPPASPRAALPHYLCLHELLSCNLAAPFFVCVGGWWGRGRAMRRSLAGLAHAVAKVARIALQSKKAAVW